MSHTTVNKKLLHTLLQHTNLLKSSYCPDTIVGVLPKILQYEAQTLTHTVCSCISLAEVNLKNKALSFDLLILYFILSLIPKASFWGRGETSTLREFIYTIMNVTCSPKLVYTSQQGVRMNTFGVIHTPLIILRSSLNEWSCTDLLGARMCTLQSPEILD